VLSVGDRVGDPEPVGDGLWRRPRRGSFVFVGQPRGRAFCRGPEMFEPFVVQGARARDQAVTGPQEPS
jgi:hypothetical protein